jgi:hypothetical protein
MATYRDAATDRGDDSWLRSERKGLEAAMDPMATVHELGSPTSREADVHAWRVQQLRRYGVPCGLAQIYADVVDWHALADLVRRGCPPGVALAIVS